MREKPTVMPCSRSFWLRFAVGATLVGGLVVALPGGIQAAPTKKPAAVKSTSTKASSTKASSTKASSTKASTSSGLCRLQNAKDFLKRSSFVNRGQLDPKAHERAVRYRVERYGSIEGLGYEHLNPKRAFSHAVTVNFMGRSLQVHEKIAPALRCVEKRIRKTCKRQKEQYKPSAVGGFRTANTFRGGEISNHLFGIAVDIDPDRNPCCGCVSPWPEHPACQGPSATIFERTALPRCWIDAFERYGFYWLGRDPQLRDTMHFEFLGDPDRILVP